MPGMMDSWSISGPRVLLVTKEGNSVHCPMMLLLMYGGLLRNILLEEPRETEVGRIISFFIFSLYYIESLKFRFT